MRIITGPRCDWPAMISGGREPVHEGHGEVVVAAAFGHDDANVSRDSYSSAASLAQQGGMPGHPEPAQLQRQLDRSEPTLFQRGVGGDGVDREA